MPTQPCLTLPCVVRAPTTSFEKNQGDAFRAKAYRGAVVAIQQLPHALTSGKEAKKLSGVGKSVADKIGTRVRPCARVSRSPSPDQPPAAVRLAHCAGRARGRRGWPRHAGCCARALQPWRHDLKKS